MCPPGRSLLSQVIPARGLVAAAVPLCLLAAPRLALAARPETLLGPADAGAPALSAAEHPRGAEAGRRLWAADSEPFGGQVTAGGFVVRQPHSRGGPHAGRRGRTVPEWGLGGNASSSLQLEELGRAGDAAGNGPGVQPGASSAAAAGRGRARAAVPQQGSGPGLQPGDPSDDDWLGEVARGSGLRPGADGGGAAERRREDEEALQGMAAPGGVGEAQLATLDLRLATSPAAVNAQFEEKNALGKAKTMLLALGGGTGASIGGTGNIYLDRDLARRMRLQDEAVLLLLLFVYFVTLFFSGSLAYRQAVNHSPVTYYADPRYHTASTDGHDLDSFLEAFNQSPKGTYLRVSGYTPTFQDAPGSFSWRGTSYIVDFTFALDLSPWVVRESGTGLRGLRQPGGEDAEGDSRRYSDSSTAIREDGVSVADASALRRFLAQGSRQNDLAVVEMQKEVAWASWEELATNIKQQIRQRGFEGLISIDRTEVERMTIYKNTQWANFMHSKTLKVILALSVIGWAVYAPYMWARCTCVRVRSKHRVNIAIRDYWPLIADHIGCGGFEPDGGEPFVPTWTPVEDDASSGSEAGYAGDADGGVDTDDGQARAAAPGDAAARR